MVSNLALQRFQAAVSHSKLRHSGRGIRCLSALWLALLCACDDHNWGQSLDAVTQPDQQWGDESWCQVQRVFHENCTNCHGNTEPDLAGETAYKRLVNVESSTYPGRVFVVPDDPGASFLYQKVTDQQGEDGGSMPLGGVLDTVSAKVVSDWIQEGAPTECGGVGLDTGGQSYHPVGWAEPDAHGPAAKFREDDCVSCHGEDLGGGSVGVSCDSCHEEGWRENCTFCHGGTDNNTGAPPRDISNETLPELLSFPPHTAHVSTNWHQAHDCIECHTKPTRVLSPGHLFVDDSTKGEAELQFSGGLSPLASYEGGGSCSNLYCHGDGQGHNGQADLTLSSTLSCASCHPDVDSKPSDWTKMSGLHASHLEEGARCSQCHGATVSSSQDILSPELHVNGSVELDLSDGVNWSENSRRCAGECHIGDEDEEHENERWD